MEKRDLKHKAYIAWLLVTTGVIVLSVFYIIFLMSDGVLFGSPLVIENNGKLVTIKDAYRPGEMVEAKISFCKNREATAITQWQLIDGYLRFYPEKTSSVGVGCHTDLVIPIEAIPKDMPPGKVHFEGTVKYKLNNLSTVIVPMQTNDFHVIR